LSKKWWQKTYHGRKDHGGDGSGYQRNGRGGGARGNLEGNKRKERGTHTRGRTQELGQRDTPETRDHNDGVRQKHRGTGRKRAKGGV